MNVAELHPDDLLDKEAIGEITTNERVLLDAHLKKCASCRLERAAREDFRAEFASVGRTQLASLVSSVLDAAAPALRPDAQQATPDPTAIPVVPVVPLRAPSASSRRRAFPLLIAAALLIVSVAAAGALSTDARRAFLPHFLVPGGLDTRAPETAGGGARIAGQRGTTSAPEAVKAPADPSAVPAPVMDVPAVNDAPVPAVSEVPAHVSSSLGSSPLGSSSLGASPLGSSAQRAQGNAGARRHETRGAVSNAGLAARDVVAPLAPAPIVNAPSAEHTASAVFDQANDARRRGEYGTAIARYREIEEAFPGTPEAVATQVVLGQLLLDRGSPADALRRFDAYVARGEDALREEAMVGRAVALGRLSRGSEERDAWTAVLAAYPRSHRADQARARITALGGK